MKIKQDPITKLWCRSDGAVLMPPDGYRFRKFRWTFGCPSDRLGHLVICHHGKHYLVHRVIARAFLPNPGGLPTVDHIDRNPLNNLAGNLRWADYRMQRENSSGVINRADYGVRHCEDIKAYQKAYNAAHREEIRARDKAYYAKMKAQGLVRRKCADSKYRWIKP